MNIFQMSFLGSILISIMLLFHKYLIKYIPKRKVIVLWYVILVRLLVPYRGIQCYRSSIRTTALYKGVTKVIGNSSFAKNYSCNNINFFQIVWLVGSSCLFLFFLFLYVKGLSRYRYAKVISNEVVDRWLEKHESKRKISIKKSKNIEVTLTYGVLRPVILLPEEVYTSEEELCYILEHEYGHIKYGDIITKLFVVLATILHWFNPLIWVMFCVVNHDLELACDETVLNRLGYNERKNYAYSLVSMTEKVSNQFMLVNNFGDNNLEERIVEIMKYKKRKNNKYIFYVVIAIFVSLFMVSSSVVFANSSFGTSSNMIIPSEEEIKEKGFPKNSFGETYGPEIRDLDYEPDLMLAQNEEGVKGYIRKKEINGNNVNTIEAALNANKLNQQEINMYLQDGKTIVGIFKLSGD